MGLGFSIRPLPPALGAAQREQLARCSVSQLADSTGRVQASGSSLAARHDGARLVGCAVTVRTRPGDQLMVQKALDLARPGDVIVVDGGGFAGQALVGEIMATLAARRGLAGFVVDGAVRDVAFLRMQSLPVFSTAVCPRGPSRAGPGEMNVAVSVAGVTVQPGDIVVGDADGVAVIPRDELASVLEAAEALRGKEDLALRQAESGTLDRSWIDAALQAGGCNYHPGA